jgi:large repetitive protein
VTITGTSFIPRGVTQVTFGGVAGTEVTVIDSSTLTVKTPPSGRAGRVDVVVKTPSGTGTLRQGFFYNH